MSGSHLLGCGNVIRKAVIFLTALVFGVHALAAPISTYPAATSPLGGSEQIIGTQAAKTVNITPAQIGAYTATTVPVTGPYPNQVPQTLPQATFGPCLNIFTYLTAAQQAAVQAGTSTVDFTPVVFNAIAALSVNVSTVYNGTNIICFPPGKYPFGSTLNIKHTVILQGSGGEGGSGASAPGTWFSFPADTTGVIIDRYNTLNDTTISPVTTGGDDSSIRDIAIISAGGTDVTKHGIWMRARGDIQNALIEGFPGNQINIVASGGSGGATEGNANGWYISRVTTYGGLNGTYIAGADANAGNSFAINSGFHAQACIFDNAFIENTHTGPQCVAPAQKSQVKQGGVAYMATPQATRSQLQTTTPGTNSAIWTLSPNGGAYPTWTNGGDYYSGGSYLIGSASTIINPYGELGFPPSYSGAHALVFGNADSNGWVGSPVVLTNNFGVLNPGPGGVLSVSTDLAYASGQDAGDPLVMGSPATPNTQLSYSGTGVVLTVGHSGLPTNWAFRWNGETTGDAIGPRRLVFDNGYGMGTGLKNVFGTGSPEGVLTANPGSLWQRTDGAARTSFYVKETGAGNTGWGAIVTGGAATTSGLTMATARILGRTTASTGAIEELTAGSGLSLSAGSLAVSGAATASGLTMSTARLLGRTTASSGAIEEMSVGTGLTLAGGSLTTSTLSGTSTSIGGGALGAGACATTTVSITGLTTSMAIQATPATYPGDAYYWRAYASSANTATVSVCAAIAGTPSASAYNLRVLQ